MHLKIHDMQNGYCHVVAQVREHGVKVAPRGQETREVMGALIELENPARSLPVGVGRGLNTRIAAVEALQLIGGVSHPEHMTRISSNMENFMDGGTFHGAYGPRIRAQMPTVVRRLRHDPDTRQALVTIWDPALDAHIEGMHDYPCTISLQFFIRDGAVVMHTHMRSNDVWWGLAYDVFQFTQLQFTVANVLRLPVGPYYHHVNSLHAYTRDFAAMDKLHLYDYTSHPGVTGFGLPHEVWNDASAAARAVLLRDDNRAVCTASERWYTEKIWA